MMKKAINTNYVGQDFDEFLAEEGMAAEVEARAIKKVVVAMLMKSGMTQVELAEQLHTSRTQIRRLLDPENTSITLSTLQRAADAAGHRLVVGFEPVRPVPRPSLRARKQIA
jgi:antitoxin HicB